MQLDEPDFVHGSAMSVVEGLGYVEHWRYGRLGEEVEPAFRDFQTVAVCHYPGQGGRRLKAW